MGHSLSSYFQLVDEDTAFVRREHRLAIVQLDDRMPGLNRISADPDFVIRRTAHPDGSVAKRHDDDPSVDSTSTDHFVVGFGRLTQPEIRERC